MWYVWLKFGSTKEKVKLEMRGFDAWSCRLMAYQLSWRRRGAMQKAYSAEAKVCLL